MSSINQVCFLGLVGQLLIKEWSTSQRIKVVYMSACAVCGLSCKKKKTFLLA